MLDEQLAALKAGLARDPGFKAQLQSATSRADAERVLLAHGFDVSQILNTAMRSVMLSDAELQATPNCPTASYSCGCTTNPTLC